MKPANAAAFTIYIDNPKFYCLILIISIGHIHGGGCWLFLETRYGTEIIQVIQPA